jgi:hypothetical protein
MASQQMINGKGFEWACAIAIKNQTGFDIVENNESKNNKKCFDNSSIPDKKRDFYLLSADKAIKHILDREPFGDSGTISCIADERGQKGDVRDIIIDDGSKKIGVSCKTNHDAYKHSRLSMKLNFVEKWKLNSNGCSDQYFNDIRPIFQEIMDRREVSDNKATWKEQNDTPEKFYWPTLHAFEAEIRRIETETMCQNFIKYIIGNNDFYKVVAMTKENKVIVQALNMNGTLNATLLKIPTKIDLIKDRNSTEYSKTIMFNKGWTFNFRIHSAETLLKPSLKFDVRAISLPHSMYSHHIDI